VGVRLIVARRRDKGGFIMALAQMLNCSSVSPRFMASDCKTTEDRSREGDNRPFARDSHRQLSPSPSLWSQYKQDRV
jgi:hypothetical protein